MDLDPVVSLAASVQAAPGTFALLLGSGVSRSAQIPTGWDVVLDLIRRVGMLTDGKEPDDPVAWYRSHGGEEPDYSKLLEQLAPTAADRRNLLNRYFEPTEEERAEGIKAPTAAHHAIARLVASGHVKVIVTTNFDRLLEAAVRQAGIEPVVISSPAAAVGAPPLVHSHCTIIKVHGDYLDPDLKNTVDELGSYAPPIDALLDRVLDEYGLVICGWSGEWDEALRSALLRAPNRRYGTYWAHLSPLTERARQLFTHRGAVDVVIAGADAFFETLANKVSALDEVMATRPLSTAIALVELKRYLADPVHRVRLYDLLMGQTERVVALPPMETNNPHPNIETMSERMRTYEAASATLVPLAATTAFFSDREEHYTLLVDVVRRLVGRQRNSSGYTLWVDMELYPALLTLYGIGIGSLAQHRIESLAWVLGGVRVRGPHGERQLGGAVTAWNINAEVCKALLGPGGANRKTPPRRSTSTTYSGRRSCRSFRQRKSSRRSSMKPNTCSASSPPRSSGGDPSAGLSGAAPMLQTKAGPTSADTRRS